MSPGHPTPRQDPARASPSAPLPTSRSPNQPPRRHDGSEQKAGCKPAAFRSPHRSPLTPLTTNESYSPRAQKLFFIPWKGASIDRSYFIFTWQFPGQRQNAVARLQGLDHRGQNTGVGCGGEARQRDSLTAEADSNGDFNKVISFVFKPLKT